MRFKLRIRHPFLVHLLGPGVLRHHTRAAKTQPKEPALKVHQNTCVHPVAVAPQEGDKRERGVQDNWLMKDCGLPVGTARPNGWLCPTHEALVFPSKKRQQQVA